MAYLLALKLNMCLPLLLEGYYMIMTTNTYLGLPLEMTAPLGSGITRVTFSQEYPWAGTCTMRISLPIPI